MASEKGRVLVTGANGFVGSHLAEAFLANGYTVRCMVRPTSDLQHVRALPVEWFHCDMCEGDKLREACRGVDAICHNAALTRALDEETFMRVNTEGTLALARASLEVDGKLSRFLYVSSQAAAGPSNGPDDLITEEREPAPVTWYGKSKLAAEKGLLEMAQELPLTIIRPVPVFGPREVDFFVYFQLVKYGLSLSLGKGERRINLIHAKELADLIVKAMESPASLGQTYFGTAYSTSYEQLSASIARALEKKTISIRVPIALLTPIGYWSRIQGRITGRPALLNSQRIVDMRQRNWLCSGDKARRELGFAPDVEMDVRVKETAGWYMENNWL
jgi:nucleoside-diphosphate-sugar epimerase